MHELSLCEGILQLLEEQARSGGFRRVLRVRLEIGALSCVEPHAMEFCFEVVSRGTLAEGARLEMMRTPARAWCATCQQQVDIHQRFDPCPQCGDEWVAPTTGDELRVKELEVQ
jgi:hydrogenase nickel incorporation protein HypA/HybF